MSKVNKEKRIFAVSPFAQKKEVDKFCFGSCGKILIGALTLCGGGFFPCGEEICPHEEKHMEEPVGSIESGPVYLRKLKEAADEEER